MGFSENLKAVRKERNVTQEQLAEMLEVSRQAISKWESGGGYPETEKLILLSRKLNVSLDYLLNEKSNIEERNKSVVYAPAGKIAITSFDGKNIVNCQEVKSSQVAGNEKTPKFVLLGVESITFWGEHSATLGWYSSADEIQKEISEINLALQQGKTEYELKHFVKVEYKGIFKEPHIVE